MKRSVIIIGGGIGGLAVAVRLLKLGYQVTIFEKDIRLGGKINQIEDAGYQFDLCASILIEPHKFEELVEFAGGDLAQDLKVTKLDCNYRVFTSKGGVFDLYNDLNKLTTSLEAHFPKSDVKGYLSFLADAYDKFTRADEYFLSQDFTSPKSFYQPTTLYQMLKVSPFATTTQYVKGFIKAKELQELIAFQTYFVGVSPSRHSNIYTILPMLAQIYGLSYFEGGIYSYIKLLQNTIYRLGGTIYTGSTVDEIVIEDKQVKGVRIGEKIHESDLVVCNADFPYAMDQLILSEEAKGKYTKKKLEKLDYSCSTFILYLGINRKLPCLEVHNLYLGEDFYENMNVVFKGELPEKPSLYIYCPSRIDLSVAPIGHEALNIIVRVPNLKDSKITWDASTIDLLRNQILETLSNIQGLEDILQHIHYEHYLTPLDFQERFNSYYGTAFGIAQTLSQANLYRPQPKSKEVTGLYFTGSSVHPGTGISVVLRSSELVVKEIQKTEH